MLNTPIPFSWYCFHRIVDTNAPLKANINEMSNHNLSSLKNHCQCYDPFKTNLLSLSKLSCKINIQQKHIHSVYIHHVHSFHYIYVQIFLHVSLFIVGSHNHFDALMTKTKYFPSQLSNLSSQSINMTPISLFLFPLSLSLSDLKCYMNDTFCVKLDDYVWGFTIL